MTIPLEAVLMMEDYNFGLVDLYDRPYEELTEAFSRSIHVWRSSIRRPGNGIWRCRLAHRWRFLRRILIPTTAPQ